MIVFCVRVRVLVFVCVSVCGGSGICLQGVCWCVYAGFRFAMFIGVFLLAIRVLMCTLMCVCVC